MCCISDCEIGAAWTTCFFPLVGVGVGLVAGGFLDLALAAAALEFGLLKSVNFVAGGVTGGNTTIVSEKAGDKVVLLGDAFNPGLAATVTAGTLGTGPITGPLADPLTVTEAGRGTNLELGLFTSGNFATGAGEDLRANTSIFSVLGAEGAVFFNPCLAVAVVATVVGTAGPNLITGPLADPLTVTEGGGVTGFELGLFGSVNSVNGGDVGGVIIFSVTGAAENVTLLGDPFGAGLAAATTAGTSGTGPITGPLADPLTVTEAGGVTGLELGLFRPVISATGGVSGGNTTIFSGLAAGKAVLLGGDFDPWLAAAATVGISEPSAITGPLADPLTVTEGGVTGLDFGLPKSLISATGGVSGDNTTIFSGLAADSVKAGFLGDAFASCLTMAATVGVSGPGPS